MSNCEKAVPLNNVTNHGKWCKYNFDIFVPHAYILFRVKDRYVLLDQLDRVTKQPILLLIVMDQVIEIRALTPSR